MHHPEYSEVLLARFKRLRRFSAGAFVLSVILIAYGLMCRLTGLYFFWESLTIGVLILPVAFIARIFEKFQRKAALDQSRTGEKIGMGFFLFILLIQVSELVTVPFMDAYKEAKIFLISDESLVKEVGPISQYSILPIGGVHIGDVQSCVHIYLTIKGAKRYKDHSVFVVRDEDGPWRVLEDEAEILKYEASDD